MKTEKEVKDKINEIMTKYHKELRSMPQWIATTYIIQALRWVTGEIKVMPIEHLLGEENE